MIKMTNEIKTKQGFNCCICRKWSLGRGDKKQFGNNPAPLKTTGQCCDSCNISKVIPIRMQRIHSRIARRDHKNAK